MCRGDVFSSEHLVELMGNVILKPMLERLVYIGEGIAGYPVGGGKALATTPARLSRSRRQRNYASHTRSTCSR